MTARDLCPGGGEPCLLLEPYRLTICRGCGVQKRADAAPSIPGGGRVPVHYRPSLHEETR